MGQIILYNNNALAFASSSDIAYSRPVSTGNNTSYRTGDSGWHRTNGTYDYVPPNNPSHIAQLDTSVNNFNTLKENNVFGNKNRFTDPVGGQDMSTHNYTIDHLTGLGICYTRLQGYNWDDAIDHAYTATTNGYNDWRIANYHECSVYWSPNTRNIGFNKSTNATSTAINYGTSCTRAGLSTYMITCVYTVGGGNALKTSTSLDFVMIRNHFN